MSKVAADRANRAARIKFTVATNAALSAVRLGISFLTVPILIGYLGAGEYGLVVTVVSVAAWLSIADGGFAVSMKNLLIKSYSQQQSAEHERDIVSTTFLISISLAFIIGIALTATIPLVPWQRVLRSEIDAGAIATLLTLAMWLTVLSIPLSIARQVYAAQQREYLAAPAQISGALIGLCATYAATRIDAGLICTGVTLLVGSFLGNLLVTAHLCATSQSLSFSAITFHSRREIVRTGGAFWIVQCGAMAIAQSGIFIANLTGGNSAATKYALHLQLTAYVTAILGLVLGPVWSALGDAWHKDDRKWFQSTVSRLQRIVVIATATFSLAIVGIGSIVFQYWSKGRVEWDPVLMALLCTSLVIQSFTGVSATALGAMGVARQTAALVVINAILHIVFTVFLGFKFGLYGIVIGGIVSYSLTSGWFIHYKLASMMREPPLAAKQ